MDAAYEPTWVRAHCLRGTASHAFERTAAGGWAGPRSGIYGASSKGAPDLLEPIEIKAPRTLYATSPPCRIIRATPPFPAAAMTPIPETIPPIEVRMAEIVFPNHTNHLGTLFGGQALAWMDKAAFLAAARYSRRTVVTARSDQVDFKLPIRIGQMVETVGRIVEVGRSSMKVEVELIAEDLHTGERKLCTRGHFVMIALDADGHPTSVPSLPGDIPGP